MGFSVKHKKTNNIPSWTQSELNTAIAAGQYPVGTTINDITLSGDWNTTHDFFATAGTPVGYILKVTNATTGAVDFVAPDAVTVAWGQIQGTLSNQTDLQNALNLKAPLANPALTGIPTAPTAAAGTNTTQIATTQFVRTEITNITRNLDNGNARALLLSVNQSSSFNGGNAAGLV